MSVLPHNSCLYRDNKLNLTNDIFSVVLLLTKGLPRTLLNGLFVLIEELDWASSTATDATLGLGMRLTGHTHAKIIRTRWCHRYILWTLRDCCRQNKQNLKTKYKEQIVFGRKLCLLLIILIRELLLLFIWPRFRQTVQDTILPY